MDMRVLSISLAALLMIPVSQAEEVYFEFSGKASGELRGYLEEGQFQDQDYHIASSVAIEPELFWELNNGSDTVTFTPFYRLDQHDEERTHGDIRELSWIHVGDDWELRTGLRKVFWGVTEFNHLVDVINQTDAVEDSDGEDKLGQPMVNLSLVRDWGIVDLFVLPGFRERSFAGSEGRLRTGLIVDTDQARYQSDDEEQHIDTAIRWSQSFDLYDVGLYWFSGTNRDPRFETGLKNGNPVLIPVYEQIDQIGFDGQATIDSWLWKLELLWRDTPTEQYSAMQAGVEYTFYGIRDSAADVGLLVEYGWDERGEDASSVSQNDLFIGSRITLNDAASTEFLAGVGYDLDYQSKSLFMEASSRFGDNWKLSLDARIFDAEDANDPMVNIEQDDLVQLTAEYFY
ncbi:hypothetical protein [Amphritea balenae]|uniref:Porin n=1 Tax=Amphritea balenae TaxID=452629 RepID=A0A3P1SWC1_9GAMM|nr:hypothetical protein [Amphritea balenae]RRD00413.1 hypothetical protein EHS89_04790 [Amphritea balenae]GGK71034.1 hypothetical protein GCM10007941_21500 [Amphritea balenae]